MNILRWQWKIKILTKTLLNSLAKWFCSITSITPLSTRVANMGSKKMGTVENRLAPWFFCGFFEFLWWILGSFWSKVGSTDIFRENGFRTFRSFSYVCDSKRVLKLNFYGSLEKNASGNPESVNKNGGRVPINHRRHQSESEWLLLFGSL